MSAGGGPGTHGGAEPDVRVRGTVLVFAKTPRAGLVKTRMSPPLSPEQAAELYGHMLDDVLAATARFAAELDLEAVLALHPAQDCRELAWRVPHPFRVIAQRGVGLGERMAYAAAEAAAAGAWRILLRGSDNPALSRLHFEQVLAGLEDCDVVVSPDRDGGYGLLGMRRPAPGLFDHPMSTHTVLDETLANAHRLGLSVRTADPCFDVDTIEDLQLLASARDDGAAELCPRTLAYLDEAGLWALAPPR